ncbi:hypothetical protein CVV38_02590 [Candidatus Peregrinibacteria bacterium HGW-Peregrinibacteria-1]|jgi:gas vesicle protein|nr:MAG: hypothetical protein CVV38_02590 [Candidatus Peregrinibacteria bacterium HGW-Peregrinibacteria-1]
MFRGIKSLLTGLAAGIGLGVLFAPKKGDELRKEIQKEVEKGGTGMKTISKNLKEMGGDLSETTKQTYEKIAESELMKKANSEVKSAYNKHVPAKTKKTINKAVKEVKGKLSKKNAKKK